MIKLKDLLTEETINPGSKEYFNKNLSDKEILKLADVYSNFPHSRIKVGPELQKLFRDIANILGYPTNPLDVITYTDGVGYVNKKKIKMNPKKAVLFQMYKDKKLTMSEYGELQKGLLLRYIRISKKFTNGITWSKF